MRELHRNAILAWLREDDPARLEQLWAAADETRGRHVGDEVHVRGLIEISNQHGRACGYCGLRGDNVVMPNVTPLEYRVEYAIYTDKACVNGTVEVSHGCLQGRVEPIGRRIGSGPAAASGA